MGGVSLDRFMKVTASEMSAEDAHTAYDSATAEICPTEPPAAVRASGRRRPRKLQLVEPGIETLCVQQLFVRPRLDELPVVEDDDVAGSLHRRESVRDHDRRPTRHQLVGGFFDPSFDAQVRSITPAADIVDDKGARWDGASVHEFEGTYGEYLLGKVSKVFPELGGDVL